MMRSLVFVCNRWMFNYQSYKKKCYLILDEDWEKATFVTEKTSISDLLHVITDEFVLLFSRWWICHLRLIGTQTYLSPAKHFVRREARIQSTERREGRIVGPRSFVTYIIHFIFHFSAGMKISQMESLVCRVTDACCHIEVLIWGTTTCLNVDTRPCDWFSILRLEQKMKSRIKRVAFQYWTWSLVWKQLCSPTAGSLFLHRCMKVCCVCSRHEKQMMMMMMYGSNKTFSLLCCWFLKKRSKQYFVATLI